MNLNEIKQYTHKVKKIQITNQNRTSLYRYVVIKIKISSNDDEIVRFSVLPNDNYIEHQHYVIYNEQGVEMGDNYYCYIPNNLNSITTLYAHFFPSDLYSYDDEVYDLVSSYNLEELFTDDKITAKRYEHHFNESGELIVQSIDPTSINNKHDPNYKNYTYTGNNNSTQQGQFPLSSKYRIHQNWQVPKLTDDNPKWDEKDDELSWEARIPFEKLTTPINVSLNYEYLPTSREYHQHYFGFEPEEPQNKTIYAFEGTNINKINKKFGSDNNYRLIHKGNPFDDTYSMKLIHDNTIPINLLDNMSMQQCIWRKNTCKNYYIYTPLDSINYCSKIIELREGHCYTLKYYIYIPEKTSLENAYISVETSDKTYKVNDAFLQKDKKMRNQWIYHEVFFTASETNIIKIVGPQKTQTDIDNSVFFTNITLEKMDEHSPVLHYGDTGVRITEESESQFKPISDYVTYQDSNTINYEDYKSDVKWQNNNTVLPTPYSQVYIFCKNETYIYYDEYTMELWYIRPKYSTEITQNITYNNDEMTVELNNNDVNIIQSYYNPNTMDLCSSYGERLEGVYGPDNHFTFYFTDPNGLPINEGTVEIGIFLQKDTYSKTSDAKVPITYKPISVKNGIVTVKNIDLSNLPQNSFTPDTPNRYYIRLKYTNDCIDAKYDKQKPVFKVLYVEKEFVRINIVQINDDFLNVDTNIVTGISRNSQDRCNLEYYSYSIDEVRAKTVPALTRLYLDHCTLKANSSVYNDNDMNNFISDISFNKKNGLLYVSKFSKHMEDYYITSMKQFPLRIRVRMTDQHNKTKEGGYCELSINDKFHQSTLVDDDGWADFYLTEQDLRQGRQTIKIEYYRKYYFALTFIYFDIVVNEFAALNDRVPINVKWVDFETGITQPIQNGEEYLVGADDCALNVITTGDYKEFHLKVYRDEDIIIDKNIFNYLNQPLTFVHATLNEWQKNDSYNFKIITSNLIDDNNNIIQNIWKDNEYTFTIRKKSS